MTWDQEKIARITNILKETPAGLTISDLSDRLKMNRNSLAKYLEMLLISGKVEMETFGTAKVYCLSHRIPLSAMLGFSSDLIAVLDGDQRVVQVNDPFLSFFGMHRDAILGRRISQLEVPELARLPLDCLPRPLHEPYPEVICKRKGIDTYLRIKSVPTVFEDGGKGCSLILEDVTIQRQYEHRLEASEARYRAVVEGQTELIIRRKPDRTVTFANDAYCRFFGVRREDIEGKIYPIQAIPEDREKIENAIQSLSPHLPDTSVEIRVHDPSGTLYWFEVSLHALFDTLGNLTRFQNVGRDITKRKNAEEDLARHAASLQFLSESAMSYVGVSSVPAIYASICTRLNQLMPRALINANSYNPIGRWLNIQSISDHMEPVLEEILGKDYRKAVFPINDEAHATFTLGKLQQIPLSFYDFTFHQFPAEACERLENALGNPVFYSIGLASDGDFFGNVNIFLPRDEALIDPAMIETFVHQVSLALRRNLAEMSLLESEEKYRVLAENSLDGIAIADVGGNIWYGNMAVGQMLIPEEKNSPVGKNLFRYLDPDAAYHLQDRIAAMSTDNPSFSGIFRIVHKSGDERWLECVATRIEYLHTPLASFALRDITGLRRTERELLVKEKAMEASINGMAILDRSFRLIYANPSFCSILDFVPKEILGSDAAIITRGSEEFLAAMRQLSETVVRDGKWFGEVRSRKKDGSFLYLMVSATLVKDEAGESICTLISVVDVTEREHFEEAFKTTYEKLREAIEFIPDPTFVVDCDRKVVVWNTAIENLTGVSREQVLGKTGYAEAFWFFQGIRPILVDLIKLPAYEVSHLYPGVRRFGDNIYVETFVPALRNGLGAFLWGKASPLTDDEGKCIGAIESIRDITEWKRAQEALRRFREDGPDLSASCERI
ncbi:MAG: PAS domain-containing protein [Methanomicrobiales archaeon]|nr:PAS domain-containing protein [Methanomicrobiales archaeon]